ncbi:MAG: hypothetical protein QF879_02315 [Candidatus Latescibacteria bacterium]|nr:hypothetical protein [Candidatus Latescibacterota bacterium]
MLHHASVPDAIIGVDGRRSIYFVNGEPGLQVIWVARDQENGSFYIIECVKLNAAFNGNAVEPDVLLFPTGEVRMYYYEGYFVGESGPTDGLSSIFSATSSDGRQFEVDGLVLKVESGTDPSVISLPDGSFLMAISQSNQTVFVSSVNGLDFQLTGVSIEGEIPELAVMDDLSFRCFVTRNDIESYVQATMAPPGLRKAVPA